ncbi:MAG: type IV pilus assembly protein PilM [Fuerstiella sp.]
MAETRSAWGIDIGQAGLKAIKIRAGEDGESVRAIAFDYIPHPKILSQPDAIPQELIKQAVETFLSRNKVGNDLVSISVPGQTSLAKFIKLPPVEPSRVAEIVKYEAKQQIPFALEEVIWDYQPIGGGAEESGFMLEAEVGLFAMKRDLVYQAMQPLTDRKTEIDLVQIAPLALYNYLSYDVLNFRTGDGTNEPPNSEDNYILLDMGCDNTTLIVSNGRNIWIRNVPIGGNHFTRALTREMKLTFAKAEHLKCNATKAPDPKAVFQAMRPVFNDYVTEIQRSIGYFGSVNRTAKIKKVIGVGNGFKMAGLQKFLQQNLQYEVERLDELNGVTGDGVLSDPLFIDNMMTFAVPYGLALQALKQTRIHTSLLPPEIVVARTIKRKKPWAVGLAASLLLAMGISTAASARVLSSLSEAKFKTGHDAVTSLQGIISSNKQSYEAQKAAHAENQEAIEQLTNPLRKRELWMELIKTVNDCLPRETGKALDEVDITLQKRLRITSFATKKVADVAEWHTALVEGGKAEDFFSTEDSTVAPTGVGYIVTVKGHHYYNSEEVKDYTKLGVNFVEDTLIASLAQWTLDDGNGRITPVGKLGISHPIVVHAVNNTQIYDPNARVGGAGAAAGGMGGYGGGGGGGYGGEGGEGGGYGMDGGYGGEAGLSGSGMMGPGMGSGMGTPGGGGYGMEAGMGDGYDPSGGYGVGGGVKAPNLAPVEGKTEEKDERKEVTVTTFVVQFAWIPVAAQDRLDSPPASGEQPAAE